MHPKPDSTYSEMTPRQRFEFRQELKQITIPRSEDYDDDAPLGLRNLKSPAKK